MDRYKKYQMIATFLVAFFIVNFAFVLLANDTKIYQIYQNRTELSHQSEQTENQQLKGYEAEINYNLLKDEFKRFWNSRYEIPTYAVTSANAALLNDIKAQYRWAKIIVFICVVGGVYCFFILAKRRMYNALKNGAILSIGLFVAGLLRLLLSKKEVFKGLREMIFKKDYSYFVKGDLVLKVIGGNYAEYMFIGYIVFFIIILLFMLFLKWFIAFLGRPHKF